MNCPYCNEEMKQGYIQCRDSVAWTSKKSMVTAFSAWSSDAIALGDGSGMFSSSCATAYNCLKCKKIVINYNNR